MLCIVYFLCFFFAGHDAKTQQNARGEDVDIKEVPYHVSIEFQGVHYCSGVIIDPEFVLTAAHCLYDYAPGRIDVRAGSSTRVKGGTVHGVIASLQPEDYDFEKRIKDISLYQVNPPIDFSSGDSAAVKMAEPFESVAANSLGVVTGFGFMELAGVKSPIHLKSGKFPVMSNETCTRFFRDSEYIFCVRVPVGGVDNCLFDHGSPFVVDGILQGIGAGSHCGKAHVPNTYTRVSSLRTWIDKTMASQKANPRMFWSAELLL